MAKTDSSTVVDPVDISNRVMRKYIPGIVDPKGVNEWKTFFTVARFNAFQEIAKRKEYGINYEIFKMYLGKTNTLDKVLNLEISGIPRGTLLELMRALDVWKKAKLEKAGHAEIKK